MAIKNIVKIWDGKNLLEENVNFLKLKTKKVTFPASDFIKDIIQDLNIEDGATVSSDPRGVVLELDGSVCFQSLSSDLKHEFLKILVEIKE